MARGEGPSGPASPDWLTGRPSGQQIANFLVGRLRKVFVPKSNGVKWFRCHCADNFVDYGSEVIASARRRCGHGDDYACGPLDLERGNRCAHGRACREAIVHENDRLSGDSRCRTRVPVCGFAASQFFDFARRSLFYDVFRNPECVDYVIVHHAHIAARDGAHSQFLAVGDAELADNEDIERRIKSDRNLECHWHAAPRQSEDQYIRLPSVVLQRLSKEAAGLYSVPEARRHQVQGSDRSEKRCLGYREFAVPLAVFV